MTTQKNRFKEYRRTPVQRRAAAGTSSKTKSPKKKSPGITQTPQHPVPSPGEDMVSFERHNRILKVEFKKTRRNEENVCNLMNRTFALRRKTVLEDAYDLNRIFTCFPFLQESDQVPIM